MAGRIPKSDPYAEPINYSKGKGKTGTGKGSGSDTGYAPRHHSTRPERWSNPWPAGLDDMHDWSAGDRRRNWQGREALGRDTWDDTQDEV